MYMYTLLFIPECNLLHGKKIKQCTGSFYLPNLADKVICLCHWASFVDFSHNGPSPISNHFVLHQRWSLRRDLSVILKSTR